GCTWITERAHRFKAPSENGYRRPPAPNGAVRQGSSDRLVVAAASRQRASGVEMVATVQIDRDGYIGASLTPHDLEATKVVVENARNADEVIIPFFSKPPRTYAKRCQ